MVPKKKKVKIEPNRRQKRIPKRCIYLGAKWFMMVRVYLDRTYFAEIENILLKSL